MTAALALLLLARAPGAAPGAAAQTDLDAFMQQVIARRDDNWKKLQQYILDESERIEISGPARTRLWGEQRDYTWFIRDGFFVRSPVRFNGVTIGERERRQYEADYLGRAKQRDRRGSLPASADAPRDVDGIIRQVRQPQFISSAYFLRFRFEEAKYALVGHEMLDGGDLLRVEYYPSRLFSRQQRWTGHNPSDSEKARAAEMERMLNKVSLVTLWIEPASHQIIRYTFNNIAFDFLPLPWLVHIDDVHASMNMGQPFPDVWLPKGVELSAAMSVASGRFDLRYALDYHDYRRADVAVRVGVPGAR